MIAVKLDSADVSALRFQGSKKFSVRSYKPASEGEETDIQEEISEDITAENCLDRSRYHNIGIQRRGHGSCRH